MKKDIKKNYEESTIGKINRIISKINKTGLILLIICYIAILSVALSFVGKDISYISEPNYEHKFYDNEITPQIAITGLRTFDDSNEMTLKYRFYVSISGRLVNNVDPKYDITNFRMFANTKATLTDKQPNSTYFFTEHTTYKTPVSHQFVMDNSQKGQNPSTVYVRLQYEKDKVTKVSTFKENIYLQPTSDDILGMNNWYDANIDTKPSATSISGAKDLNKSVGTLEVISYKNLDTNNKETGVYKTGMKIKIRDNSIKKFHIDMQSWILTKDGEYLPFIGVYNYTGYSKTYTASVSDIDYRLNPEYIVAKLTYLDENNKEYNTCYFKQNINDIRSTYPSEPQVGVDAGALVNDYRVLYTSIAIVATFAMAVLVIFGTYYYNKKKEEK